MAISTGARAADAVVPYEPAAQGFNWSGFYLGVGGGFGAVVHEVSSPVFLPGASLNGIGGEGVFGEITAGYDYVFSNRFLVGGFVDGRFGNIGPDLDLTLGGTLNASVENSYGFDAGLRLGYLVTPTTLGYLLGGYSWQKFEFDTNIPGLNEDWDRSGFIVGVGMETVITGNWTLKTEYRYADYGTQAFFPIPGAAGNGLELDASTHTFHVGANYRFGAQDGAVASFETPAYDFTGFYVGGAVGAGAVVHDLDLNLAPGVGLGFNGLGGEGIFGELSVGYDHEFSNRFVAGIMVDGNLSGISSELDLGPIIGPGSVNVDAEYGFDILARLGMKLTDSSMAYVTGGYSFAHFDLNASGAGSIYDWDANGFSVGGGLEAGLNENLAVNLEYRYSQFEDEDFGSGGFFTVEPSFHTVRIGAKWKFRP